MKKMKKAKNIEIKSIVINYSNEGVFGLKTVYEIDGE